MIDQGYDTCYSCLPRDTIVYSFSNLPDPLGDSSELVCIHNPADKLDHAKREIVAARFYEIPAEAINRVRSQ